MGQLISKCGNGVFFFCPFMLFLYFISKVCAIKATRLLVKCHTHSWKHKSQAFNYLGKKTECVKRMTRHFESKTYCLSIMACGIKPYIYILFLFSFILNRYLSTKFFIFNNIHVCRK